MAWKNRLPHKEDKNTRNKSETSVCPVCGEAFKQDEIEDHVEHCVSRSKEIDDEEQTEGPKEWCHMCQRVIAGVPMQCGRHTNVSSIGDPKKK